MLRLLIIGLFAGILSPFMVYAQDVAARDDVVSEAYSRPEFQKYPSSSVAMFYYPKDAYKKRIEGLVFVFCYHNSQGRLVDCEVQSEKPLNLGFGQNTKAMLEEHVLVQKKSRPPEGVKGTIKIRYSWKIR